MLFRTLHPRVDWSQIDVSFLVPKFLSANTSSDEQLKQGKLVAHRHTFADKAFQHTQRYGDGSPEEQSESSVGILRRNPGVTSPDHHQRQIPSHGYVAYFCNLRSICLRNI